MRYARCEADGVERDVALHAGAQFVQWVELFPPFIFRAADSDAGQAVKICDNILLPVLMCI